MLEDTIVLDKSFAEKPIYLPEHPYIAKVKDFGLDELIAGGIDPITTTLVNAILPTHLRPIVLPFVGPVTEKIGFFPAHFWKAKRIYDTSSGKNRKRFIYYFLNALRDGSSNLIKDLVYHDPLYMGLMYYGLTNTNLPPGVLSVASYISAVFIAAGIDVGKDELRHSLRKKSLKRVGFEEEQYYESRFYVLNEANPEKVMEGLMKEFNLSSPSTLTYRDRYFGCDVPTFSGRTAKMRFRQRQKREFENNVYVPEVDSSWINTFQIIFTRARECKRGIDQCRYFPIKKEKLYLGVPSSFDSISDLETSVQNVLSRLRLKDLESHSLTFDRTNVNNTELAVCTDKVNQSRPFYVLELKVYKDLLLLQQAMRYLMVECPIAVVQTTYGKKDLLRNSPPI